MPIRLTVPAALRAVLFLVLLISSIVACYATWQNERSVRSLAAQALENTALAISSSAESALRESRNRNGAQMREILSDRVVAYALIADRKGTVLFHTNPRMSGTRLSDEDLPGWLNTGRTFGRYITLGTGLPAYEFNYILNRADSAAELLRLVIYTTSTDRIVSHARRLWLAVAGVLLILWASGVMLERGFTRQLRLQAEVDMKEKLALIGQMTATLSHEIRNALGSLKGYAQLVDEQTPGEDPRKGGLAVVLTATGRIEALVNNLLLYSREEHYIIEPLETSRIIGEAVAAMPKWEGRIEVKAAPGLRTMADKDKLLRVLLNGFRNAAQAMGNDGLMRIESGLSGRWAEIRIEDSGPGVPEKEIPRLFTPFHTTKTEGTGLGLAYSKKVVEAMGGRIKLINREGGGGAVLSILLPKMEETGRE